MIKARLVLFVLSLSMLFGVITSVPTLAAPKVSTGCDKTFLTFPPWYRGLTDGTSECNIKPIGRGDNDMRQFIFTIVLNVIEIILQLVGYAATGFLIWGGYQYLISAGEANKMTAAKKTIMNASIGLVISLFSVAVVNIIVGLMK